MCLKHVPVLIDILASKIISPIDFRDHRLNELIVTLLYNTVGASTFSRTELFREPYLIEKTYLLINQIKNS